MFGLTNVEMIEGAATSEDEYYTSIQAAINSLSAWRMQGSMGRAMMAAIESGHCMLGHKPTADYWGNRIPSRDEVKEGTKGSREYVVKRMGEAWAVMMEGVDEAVH